MEKKQKKEVLNPFHRLRNGCIIWLSSENSLWNCCFCEIREQTNNNLYQNIDIYMYFPANLPKFIENRAADENLKQTDNRKKCCTSNIFVALNALDCFSLEFSKCSCWKWFIVFECGQFQQIVFVVHRWVPEEFWLV